MNFSILAHAGNIGETRYVIGGTIGTFMGLGLGHAIQGRWISDDAYFFTIAEIASAAAIVTAKPTTTCSGSPPPALRCNMTYPDYVNGAVLVLLAVRIYEIIDVWSTSTHMSVSVIPLPQNPKLILALKF